MPIDLGLSRTVALLSKLGNPQLASNFIHIAGTNGKGSVCAYITSLLLQNTRDFIVGRFTSPHLIYRYDCVTLNNVPVTFDKFSKAEKQVLAVNEKYKIGATEFELLTATAFHLFELENVDLAVVEVGLGGRLDATNVIEAAVFGDDGSIVEKGVLATGITKIGLDHEGILGTTLEQIALQKAGIIKPLIPNVVDGSNDPNVLAVVHNEAKNNGSKNFVVESKSNQIETSFGLVDRNISPLKGDYQLQNLSLSLKILDIIFPTLQKAYPQKFSPSLDNIKQGVKSTQWPGRLQSLDLKYSSDADPLSVLLDGAHNGQAAKELHKYLDQTYGPNPITFIIAVTTGKDIDSVFSQLIRPSDKVIATKFGDVQGMPWIKAVDPTELKILLSNYTNNITIGDNLPSVFEKVDHGENIVICGSLYLVGEVLKLYQNNQLKV